MKLRLRINFYEFLRKSLLREFLRKSQLNSTAKNSRTVVFQQCHTLHYKRNALTSGISRQRTHSNLVGIFSHLHHSCVLNCHTGFLLHLGRFQHCKEAVAKRCSVKKVFLEISQNSQEKTCARVSFLIKRL